MFSLSMKTPQILLLSLIFSTISILTQASVPPSETFQYINEGDLGEFIVEYDANYRALAPFAQPFQLCFYNTTPNEYTLALRMGTVRSESLMRWVWEANRNNPLAKMPH
ncbi:D-mannose binding lectin protein with Apple-like carbohydrate-binding domain [Euphorbia peplus]|nr:D-mannose binding lectin protein with Apple-like carbohydrate-binding domain [Euphorbia peplus]